MIVKTGLWLGIILGMLFPRLYADDVFLMSEEFPPYQFYKGEGEQRTLTGISIEIVQAIQKKLGHQQAIRIYPWSRSLKLLKKRKNSALFSTARTPGREDQFQWVGPLSKLEIVFFKKRGSAVSSHRLKRLNHCPKLV